MTDERDTLPGVVYLSLHQLAAETPGRGAPQSLHEASWDGYTRIEIPMTSDVFNWQTGIFRNKHDIAFPHQYIGEGTQIMKSFGIGDGEHLIVGGDLTSSIQMRAGMTVQLSAGGLNIDFGLLNAVLPLAVCSVLEHGFYLRCDHVDGRHTRCRLYYVTPDRRLFSAACTGLHAGRTWTTFHAPVAAGDHLWQPLYASSGTSATAGAVPVHPSELDVREWDQALRGDRAADGISLNLGE